MSFQNEPISIDKHITKTIDNSNKLPTSNAVQEFVTSKTSILNTIDSTVTDESNNLITSNAVHDFTVTKIAEALASLGGNDSSSEGLKFGTYTVTLSNGETTTVDLGWTPQWLFSFYMTSKDFYDICGSKYDDDTTYQFQKWSKAFILIQGDSFATANGTIDDDSTETSWSGCETGLEGSILTISKTRKRGKKSTYNPTFSEEFGSSGTWVYIGA